MQVCGALLGGFQTMDTRIASMAFCFYPSFGHPVLMGRSWRTSNASDVITQCNAKQRKRNGRVLVWASLGFTPDPSVGAERAANELLKDAAMLLVYQDIFKNPPAKAFLEVLHAIRLRADGSTLFRVYGEFFRLMATGGHPSWQDFVLDGILAGEGSPFARAAANVGNPESAWSSGIPESLRLAAASDLDSLQKLSIAESTLVGWVADIASDVRPEWRQAAAANISTCSAREAYPSSLKVSYRDFGDSLDAQDDIHAGETISLHASEAFEVQNGGQIKLSENDDIMQIDREMWRKKIGGLWKWSDAVPLLEDYYVVHSYGRIASTLVFRWKQGKLIDDSNFISRGKLICDLSHQKMQLRTLQKNFRKHASRLPAQNVLLCGPSGVGKTQLLKATLYTFAQKGELRILSLPSYELKNLHELLEDLAQHWQLQFVVFIDDLILKVGDENIKFLRSALNRTSQYWPSNILLCCTSTQCLPLENQSPSFVNFKQIFGMVIQLKHMSLEEYLLCVDELLHCRRMHLPSLSVSISDVSIKAKEWVQHQDSYTVQDAFQFVTNIFQLE